MIVLFAGYRDWALNAIESLKKHDNIEYSFTAQNESEFYFYTENLKKIDLIVCIGWSWIIKKETLENIRCIGMHPSNLPEYRGGSPVQNQVIDGITQTKISLFEIAPKLDAGAIFLKQDCELSGNNCIEIFDNISKATISLITDFFNRGINNINSTQQDLSIGTYKKRRKAEDSKIELSDFTEKSLVYLYNKIRCLTDPYPNAYIEDTEGNRLIFKEVHFLKAHK